MASAIKSIFPVDNHRWCRWHVLRKTKQKVGPVYSKKSNFKKEFNKLVTQETVVSRFERKWRQLMRKYNLVENQFTNRIFKHRAKWAKPYFMGIFCVGMTSTQRSESANHMLKQFIQRSAPMHMFVRKFSEFQMDRNDQEEKEVYITKQMRRKRRVGVPIERHAELIYTRRIYEKFYNELYYSGSYAIKSRNSDGSFEVANSFYDGEADQAFFKVVYVPGDKISCHCGLFEHIGLLCRHSLKVLVNLDVKEIPKNNIMPRWLKNVNDISEGGTNNTGLDSIPGTSDVLKKRELVNRVLELAYAPEPITEELCTQFMGVIDRSRVNAQLPQNSTMGGHPSLLDCSTAVPRSESTFAPLHIRCPDRPNKNGRPSNTSLKSWKDAQKRNKSQSTDEENPKGVKTRLIVDVLGP